jgi:hypothetical protein
MKLSISFWVLEWIGLMWACLLRASKSSLHFLLSKAGVRVCIIHLVLSSGEYDTIPGTAAA